MANLLAEKRKKKESMEVKEVEATPKKLDRDSMEYKKQRDKELVKGIFHNYEVPGGGLKFPYRKYKGDKTEFYEMEDGKVYTVPLGVAKHLNNGVKYIVHKHLLDEHGKPSKKIGTWKKRCSFESLDFIDEEAGYDTDIVTIENI